MTGRPPPPQRPALPAGPGQTRPRLPPPMGVRPPPPPLVSRPPGPGMPPTGIRPPPMMPPPRPPLVPGFQPAPGVRPPAPMGVPPVRPRPPVTPPRSLGQDPSASRAAIAEVSGVQPPLDVRGAVSRPMTAESSAPGGASAIGLDQEITKLIKLLKIKDAKSGPFKGQTGRSVNVVANYLSLKIDQYRDVSEYEVVFDPPVDNVDERFKILGKCGKVPACKIFDGAKLFLPETLDPPSVKVSAVTSSGLDVVVNLKFKRRFNFTDPDAMQIYNILFNRIMRTMKYVNHKRSFFDPGNATDLPIFKLSVWPGYSTSINRFDGGVLLQCDVANRILRTETVRDYLSSKTGRGVNYQTDMARDIVGSSVVTVYNNRTYVIEGIDWETNPRSQFTLSSGEKISFIDYYKRQYNIDIKDASQPLLVSQPKLQKMEKLRKEQAGVKVLLLVPELCLMTGMTDEMRNNFRLMKELSTITRRDPSQRQSEVTKFVESVLSKPEAAEHLKVWGIGLSSDFVSVSARQLPPETIHFDKASESAGPKGDWGRHAMTRRVLNPVHLRNWAVVYPSKFGNEVKKFVQCIGQSGQKMGINIAMPKNFGLGDDQPGTYAREIRKVVTPDLQLVMAVFPEQRGDRYSAFKKICYHEKVIPSQGMLIKTIKDEKKMMAVAQKVVLQMNCKLGGELWQVDIPTTTLMVIGIDVWHSKTDKSVAAMVASYSPALTRYYSETAEMTRGEEVIPSLRSAVRNAFVKYYNENGRKFPRQVVFFRDGVSDSQIETVERNESDYVMAHIVEMVNTINHMKITARGPGTGTLGTPDFSPDPNDPDLEKPSMTYVVVQKRINARFYRRTGEKTFENPDPGLVVDTTVTKENFKDFYLVPQAVRQGTVTPTHYVVAAEYGKTLSADNIQRLAFKLCHMYYNWPGTVRVPAPCQYAHKLCDLVGETLKSPVTNCPLSEKLHFL